jgi:hypothetical protein
MIRRARRVFGRELRSTTTVLPIDRLQEITLEKQGESPAFVAGLSALVIGTFLGARFFVEGLRAPGGSTWLWGLGFLLVALSLVADFFLGSGRSPKNLVGKPCVVIKLTAERGWILTGLSLATAKALVDSVSEALKSGDNLSLRAVDLGSRAAETDGGQVSSKESEEPLASGPVGSQSARDSSKESPDDSEPERERA